MIRYIIHFSILLIPLLLSSCLQEVSPAQAETFIKFYGNSMMDEARDVEVLGDGSYAICGVDYEAGVGERAVLIVTDQYGNVKPGFPRYYSEGNLSTGVNTMVVKGGGTGGFLLVGYVDKPLGETSIQKDLFLVRTSLDGQELWKKSFGSIEDESVLHASEMNFSGGYMLAGYQVQNGKKDIMVMGVTDQGQLIELGLNYIPVSENATANYILNAGDKYLCVCTYNKVGSASTDILILNFDEELSPNVGYLGEEELEEIGQCIIEDDTDKYLVLGNRINVSGNSEMVVYRVEIDGLLVTGTVFLEKVSESNIDLFAKRFVKLEDGRYAIVGTRQSGEHSDMFLQFLNTDFTEAERIIFGSAGDQSGADIDLPDDGGLLMVGTNGFDANSMITLIKTGVTGDL